jgi:hypothetical protein
VSEEDPVFQRTLRRENSPDTLKHYQLTTVTFGMASSAFLATRSLQQIAFDCEVEYPEISREILHKFYIDDYLSGAAIIEHATQLKQNLTIILQQRGFSLRKWKSNATEIRDFPNVNEDSLISLEDNDSTTKILGLHWNSQSDY